MTGGEGEVGAVVVVSKEAEVTLANSPGRIKVEYISRGKAN